MMVLSISHHPIRQACATQHYALRYLLLSGWMYSMHLEAQTRSAPPHISHDGFVKPGGLACNSICNIHGVHRPLQMWPRPGLAS